MADEAVSCTTSRALLPRTHTLPEPVVHRIRESEKRLHSVLQHPLSRPVLKRAAPAVLQQPSVHAWIAVPPTQEVHRCLLAQCYSQNLPEKGGYHYRHLTQQQVDAPLSNDFVYTVRPPSLGHVLDGPLSKFCSVC